MHLTEMKWVRTGEFRFGELQTLLGMATRLAPGCWSHVRFHQRQSRLCCTKQRVGPVNVLSRALGASIQMT